MAFESEAKFHEALGYLCERYTGFKAKDLKHVLGITSPNFMDGLFERIVLVRDLRYIEDSSGKFTQGEIYESMTFNGATYEIIDNNGDQALVGSVYFEWVEDMEESK